MACGAYAMRNRLVVTNFQVLARAEVVMRRSAKTCESGVGYFVRASAEWWQGG